MHLTVLIIISVTFFCCNNKDVIAQQPGRKLNLSSPVESVIVASSLSANKGINSRTRISLLATVNTGGSVYPLGYICTEGMRFALDNIRQMPNFLSNCNYSTIRPVAVTKLVPELNRNANVTGRFPLTLGTFCPGLIYTGEIVDHYNFVGVTSHSGVLEPYKQRRRYQSFFVNSLPSSMSFEALAEFLPAMGWYKYAIISENSDFFNELESRLISGMDRKNASRLLGVFRFPYESGVLPDSAHIESAVAELAKVKPRIIILDSSSPARVACWLHRHGLVGPAYVYFVFAPTAFTKKDPGRFSPWCTEKMLEQVLQRVFIHGNGNSLNLASKAYLDSLGVSPLDFESHLKSVINSPEQSPFWWFWRAHCYDTVVTAAMILNATENILAKRNQTLADWTTDKLQFQQQGVVIKQAIKDGMYATRFRTLAGEVEYDRETTMNTKGHMMVGIFQVRRRNSTADLYPFPVAVYHPDDLLSNNAIKFGPEQFVWETPGGRVPSDSIRVVDVMLPLISLSPFETSTLNFALFLVFFLFLTLNIKNTENKF